ncbi:MAG: type II and III secretion system protein family protein [Thermodesulfobacteriota bacterium]|nr:type II and III secretion system protein family protein [Thermodesulfobacteriota bacterium]
MFTARGFIQIGAASIFIFVLLFFPTGLWAVDSVFLDTQEPRKLQLVSGKTIILRSHKPVTRISVGIPMIAGIKLLTPYEMLITGNLTGTTNLILWQGKKVSAVYDLDVVYDISRLKQKLQEILPNEPDLHVIATQDTLTLSGMVSSTANLSQAVALAESYAGYVIKTKKKETKTKNKGTEENVEVEWAREARKVCNLVQVAGVHQVMLEVRVAEMSKSLTNRLGIDFIYSRGFDLGISSLGGLFRMEEPEIHWSSDNVKALFRFSNGSVTWTGLVDALKEDGLVRVLAEPTLVALSGQTASFLAGGEFPVLFSEDDGISVEYKPFGVSLSFSPTVLSENKISIKVAPEVSEIDYSIGVSYLGYVVPGLTTRRASTIVELADGQSFAIAGLLDERIRDKISKFPLLGDVPVLGALFRSREFRKNETELIIVITPHLVKPLDLAKQTLPTDFYIEPDDMELYILGLMQGREKNRPSTVREELDGDFGHVMPYPD